MTQTHSVACPSCGASLKVTKASLVGKKVPCPSCKAPFVIQAPAAQEYVPLADDPPNTKSGAGTSESVKQITTKTKSGTIQVAAASSDDIPLLAEGESSTRAKNRVPDFRPKSGETRSGSKSDASVRRKEGSGETKRPASDSKTAKVASPTESSQFDAMLADSSGTDLFDDDDAKPQPPKRAKPGKKSESDIETSEFDSMLNDTEEQDERAGGQLPTRRRRRPQSTVDDNDPSTLPTVEMDLADEDDGLPPAPGRARPRGGWAVAERGPVIVWTCVGAGVLILILLYVLFSGGSSSGPLPAANPPTASNAEANDSEVAETGGGDKAQAKEGDSAGEEGSLLRRKRAREKQLESTKKPLEDSQKSATPPEGKKSEQADPTDQKVPAEGKGESTEQKPAGAAQHRPRGIGRNNAGAIAEARIDPKSDLASTGSQGTGVIGRAIPPFSASAVDNTTFQSAEHKEKVLVVAFLGVECPLANLYAPSLAELSKRYSGKSVAIVAVNSNAQDTLDQTRAQARANGLTFPVLKDAGNAVAELFGAARTPEIFVLDAQRTVRYHGMLDDQYGYRERRAKPTKTYALDAIEALLKSGPVAVAETPLQGCHIGRVTKPSDGAKTSYYRDVLPILQDRCQQCHRKGEIGPFALSDYEVVRDWGPTIREAVSERRMPPWPADPKIGKFSNDISLTEKEIDAIRQWVDEGCPQGDAAEKPPAKQFVEGWNIGKPDKIYSMPETYHVAATGVIEYQDFNASPVFTKDTWVQAVECRFGNRSVVHHMLVLLDFPKDPSRSQDGVIKGFFAAGAPGSTYFVFPNGYAKKIPKGARLRFQMHYTPNGSPANDLSKFGVVLAKGNSPHEVQTFALGNADFLIPAGDADHKEWASQPVLQDVTLTTLMPHLHVRGKSFTFFLERPDGTREPLLSVPKWDFNWQYQYQLSRPLTVPKGSKLVVEAHWDNSAGNPNNIFPLVDARFGEQTFDEMFIGYINAIPSKSVADAGRPGRSRKRS
jgi:peroxiredoxin